MTTAFYVIKTYQNVFERRMRTLQFRSPGIAPGNADESAPGHITHTKRCLNVCKVRENMPPFARSADDATRRAQRQNLWN